jgi:hypothetical protein
MDTTSPCRGIRLSALTCPVELPYHSAIDFISSQSWVQDVKKCSDGAKKKNLTWAWFQFWSHAQAGLFFCSIWVSLGIERSSDRVKRKKSTLSSTPNLEPGPRLTFLFASSELFLAPKETRMEQKRKSQALVQLQFQSWARTEIFFPKMEPRPSLAPFFSLFFGGFCHHPRIQVQA